MSRTGIQKRSAALRFGVLPALVLSAGALAVPAFGSGGAPPLCATANLRLDLVPPIGAGAGNRFWDMTLRNVGSTTCHLKGFPGVGLLDSNANPINLNVPRDTGFTPHDVVLHPWHRAWFTFHYALGAFCPGQSVSAFGIRVFPPNSTSRLVYYSGKFSLCHPTVFPVRPGRPVT